LKQFLPNSDSGFTLIELLVASSLGLLMLGIVTSTFISSREMARYDMDRTMVQQNLRGTMDIIGMNIRLAGENLPPTFPAIELIDGAGTDPDQLIVRRNLRDEILKLCEPIDAGTQQPFYFATPGTTPGCTFSDQMQNYNTWLDYLTTVGSDAKGYIYDPTTDLGEFFPLDEVEMEIDNMYVRAPASYNWTNTYEDGQAAGYILEEWRFQLVGDIFQAVIDEDSLNPRNITFGVSDFQVEVTLEDGSVLTDFSSVDDWTEITAIAILLEGDGDRTSNPIERSLRASFFPRNILSN